MLEPRNKKRKALVESQTSNSSPANGNSLFSAFEVLMAANVSKKKNPPKPIKRKRKAPVESQTLKPSPANGNSLFSNENAVEKHIGDFNSLNNGTLKKSSLNNGESNECLVAAKKPRSSISPDESLLELKKKAVEFKVKRAVYWGEGGTVPFMFVAKAFDAISNESGRNAITEILCNMLWTVMETSPDDLLGVVCFLAMSNKFASACEGLDLGIGEALITKALAEACGTKEPHIKKQYKELGDLGLVAKARRSSQPLLRKPAALTVAKVLDTFRLIAKESGKDSQGKKKNHIKALLVAATDCECQYLIRLLQEKLRIGLADQTLLTALGYASVHSEKHSTRPANCDNPLEEAAKIIKQVYSVVPVYDKIVPALLAGGVWNLSKTCDFSPGIPVGSMLAQATTGVSKIVDKFQNLEFTCEYKYDGERAQIHCMENGSVEIFSRNAERSTGKFPDVVSAITKLKKPSVTSFILDCELVAYDREKQKIQPFQILSTRARKNVVMNEIKVNVYIYAFDILYINGQRLLQEQLNVRREHLYGSFQEEPGFFQFATAITSNDPKEIQKFLNDAVNSSSERLIIKTLNKDATYEPSKRSLNWLKLKKDYMESIGDSLDLVPIAGFHGKGKRAGLYGAFLLACYDNEDEEFQSICKIGKGISLRFPRLVRVREDKNPEQASSSDMVAVMYDAQKHNSR